MCQPPLPGGVKTTRARVGPTTRRAITMEKSGMGTLLSVVFLLLGATLLPEPTDAAPQDFRSITREERSPEPGRCPNCPRDCPERLSAAGPRLAPEAAAQQPGPYPSAYGAPAAARPYAVAPPPLPPPPAYGAPAPVYAAPPAYAAPPPAYYGAPAASYAALPPPPPAPQPRVPYGSPPPPPQPRAYEPPTAVKAPCPKSAAAPPVPAEPPMSDKPRYQPPPKPLQPRLGHNHLLQPYVPRFYEPYAPLEYRPEYQSSRGLGGCGCDGFELDDEDDVVFNKYNRRSLDEGYGRRAYAGYQPYERDELEEIFFP